MCVDNIFLNLIWEFYITVLKMQQKKTKISVLLYKIKKIFSLIFQ